MATRAERRRALDRMTPAGLAEFEKSFGGTWYSDRKGQEAAAIEALLTEVEGKGIGDRLDRRLNLPTDAEQQLELQRKAVATSESSTQASWLSARAAWIVIAIAVASLIIAIIALVK